MIWDITWDIVDYDLCYMLHKSPGEIVGPVVGGALYEIGGFTLPFAVMGSTLALSSVFIYFVLPDTPQPPTPEPVEWVVIELQWITVFISPISTYLWPYNVTINDLLFLESEN